MARFLVTCFGLLGVGCATVPLKPLSDERVPEVAGIQEVSRETMDRFLEWNVPGESTESLAASRDIFLALPENAVRWIKWEERRVMVVVAHQGPRFFAAAFQLSRDEGLPIIPRERIHALMTADGPPFEAQLGALKDVSRCLAVNATCPVLVIFANGNATKVTFSVNRDNPLRVGAKSQFYKAGSFARSDFPVVIEGASKVSLSGTPTDGWTTVPLMVTPKHAETVTPRTVAAGPQGI